MGQDSTHADGSVVLSATPVATPAPRSDRFPFGGATVTRLPLRLPRIRTLTGSRAGYAALGFIVFAVFAVVLYATGRSSPLVPNSDHGYPGWEAGPLHLLVGGLTASYETVNLAFSAVLVMMLVAYGIAVAAVRSLSMRVIASCVVAVHLILLLGAPLQLNDVFNYLGYARLGAVHHLDPYGHGIATILHDPVYRLSSWHHLHSPYGWLFTAVTYPIALLPVPVAYWVLKTLAVGLSLVFIWLVARCATLLGRDPRFAVVFVAANPIYLIYAVGGFHNDFFMLVPMMAAVALMLSRRDRSAGAMVALAVAVKFTAVLVLPFLLLGARPNRRRVQMVIGAVLAAVPVLVLSAALFGTQLPDLRDQSTLLTNYSIPNVVGLLIGAGGGAPWLLRVANVAVVLTVALLLRRRVSWLAGAGWATVALVVSLAWLMPWYVVWVLPFAALAGSVRLRRVAIALSVFLVLTFMPAAGMFTRAIGFNPQGGSAGQASASLQDKLAR